MDTFGFTKKKFLGQCHENQHRHIIKWLSTFYQTLTTNRANQESLDFFLDQYNHILRWLELNTITRPGSNIAKLWIETVSDRIHFHRLCIGKPVRDYDLLEKVQTKDSNFSCNQRNINCHLALDGLRSLFNTGSIFRTCEAAGFNSIILGNMPGKEHPGVQKTAMGAHKWIDQEKTEDLAQTLLDKKKAGFQIIGIETMKGSTPYHDATWKKNTIVVFGNEEYGISSHVMAVCDEFVSIPMSGRKNSLNVANAVAVICFHITGYIRDKKID
jgi:23S rRNA (guanosine2251-2'-O)-methyltransferase